MRQKKTTGNALKSGYSFDYRDIFSGLSNEKMSPVLCMPRWQKTLPPGFSIGGFQVHTGSICFHLLEGKSLVLLKTNFSKKPKNPV